MKRDFETLLHLYVSAVREEEFYLWLITYSQFNGTTEERSAWNKMYLRKSKQVERFRKMIIDKHHILFV